MGAVAGFVMVGQREMGAMIGSSERKGEGTLETNSGSDPRAHSNQGDPRPVVVSAFAAGEQRMLIAKIGWHTDMMRNT